MNHEFIAPGLALLGTLVAAALGFYQWRKQSANANRAANAAARREAYEGLWQRLEEINLDLRKSRDKVPSLTHDLSSINAYFLAHSLYFDDADQDLQSPPVLFLALLARDQGRRHLTTHTRSSTSTSNTIGRYTSDASSRRRAARALPGDRTITKPNPNMPTPSAE